MNPGGTYHTQMGDPNSCVNPGCLGFAPPPLLHNKEDILPSILCGWAAAGAVVLKTTVCEFSHHAKPQSVIMVVSVTAINPRTKSQLFISQ